MNNDPSNPAAPWWKFGFVWLVISGPAVVAMAAVVTTWLAVSNPDPVIAADYYRRGMEINKTLAARDKANLPAVQGRNHVVTPVKP